MRVLGISAFYHDSAAALVEDDRIVAAAQEERFTRKKHDSSFPQNAISYCLQEGKICLDELDYVVFYDKPFLKFVRLLEPYVATAPRGFRSFKMAIPLWLREKLFQNRCFAASSNVSVRTATGRGGCCSVSTTSVMRHRHFFPRHMRMQRF